MPYSPTDETAIPIAALHRWLTPRLASALDSLDAVPLRVSDYPQWLGARTAIACCQETLLELERLARWIGPGSVVRAPVSRATETPDR